MPHLGGVKAYNLDNLSTRKGSEEHFKVFIGFKVAVCTNLCVFSDGFTYDLRVRNQEQLYSAIYQLVASFNAIQQLKKMATLQEYCLTEKQFAQLIGRCRMYQYLPPGPKNSIPELQFGDSQINCIFRLMSTTHSDDHDHRSGDIDHPLLAVFSGSFRRY